MGIDAFVWQDGKERVFDTLHLEGQPTAVACDIRQEVATVAAGAETSQAHPTLLGVGIRCTLVDIGGGDDRFELVEFPVVHGIDLVERNQPKLGDAQSLVLVEVVGVGEFACVGAEMGWDKVFEPGSLVDTLLADEHEHLVVDHFVFHPRSHHRYEPLLEADAPEAVSGAAAGRPVGAMGRRSAYRTPTLWAMGRFAMGSIIQ